MWSNDFEGEAFLEINKITGINHDNRPLDELKPIELPLTHPKGSCSSHALSLSLFIVRLV